jgi:PTH1 family peptidyl-tRNA hydrolase
MSSRTVAQTRIPLLIISLGNPGKGGLTYHDAGHGALSILRRQRVPENWTLWASPTYMNVSGPAVKKQWNNWAGRRDGGMLVVLQDELEMEFGQVRKRAGWSSAKGHNGIKSIQQVLPRDTEWWRLAIGIGRPESRDTDSVSNFVLSKIPRREMQVLENKGDDLMELLMEITE